MPLTVLYGGTFDPIHFGHLITAQRAMELLKADRVVFIPARISPHKLGGAATGGTEPQQRLEMVRLAIASEPRFAVDDCELLREPPSYTFDTVDILKRKYGGDMVLLIGADQLARFHTWHRVTDLLAAVGVAILPRTSVLGPPGDTGRDADLDAVRNHLGEQIFRQFQQALLDTPLIAISATEIRQRVKAGLSIDYYTPVSVVKYIGEHRCYV